MSKERFEPPAVDATSQAMEEILIDERVGFVQVSKHRLKWTCSVYNKERQCIAASGRLNTTALQAIKSAHAGLMQRGN